jgi:hypothetical protein
MELMCPHCHTNNRVGEIGAADAARFVCAGCGIPFEAMLVEGALVPVLPREGVTPFAPPPPADDFDILSIPQEPPAEPPAPQAQVLEDVFVSAPDFGPVVEAAPAFAPSEADPLHITEPAAERAAPPPEADEAEEAEVMPPPVVAAKVAAKPRPAVDKYAVGMRVLRISPMWLLLSSVGFFAVLLTMSWMSQPVVPVGEAVAQLPNQATSKPVQPAAVAQVEHAKATAEKALPPKARASAEPPAESAAQPEAADAPAPAAPKAEAPAPTALSGSGNFTVQVGSFNNPTEANVHVSRLRAAGVEARAVPVELPKRGKWYRVQAGRFQTRDEAAKGGVQLRAKGLAAAAIVTEVN